jgi:hypothetical protein
MGNKAEAVETLLIPVMQKMLKAVFEKSFRSRLAASVVRELAVAGS